MGNDKSERGKETAAKTAKLNQQRKEATMAVEVYNAEAKRHGFVVVKRELRFQTSQIVAARRSIETTPLRSGV